MIGNTKLKDLSNEVIEFIKNSNNTTPAIFGEFNVEEASIIVPHVYKNEFKLPEELNYTLNDFVMVTLDGNLLNRHQFSINNETIVIDDNLLKPGVYINIILLSIISNSVDNIVIPIKATEEMIETCEDNNAYMTPLRVKQAIDRFSTGKIVKNIQW